MEGSAAEVGLLKYADSANWQEFLTLILSRRCPLRGCGEFTGFASAADLKTVIGFLESGMNMNLNWVAFLSAQCEFFRVWGTLELTFRIFGVVLEDPRLTMDDSLLSLRILCTTWLVFGLS